MEENLKKIEKFFKYDMEIKRILSNCVMKEEDSYNNDSLLKYKDKLYRALKDLEYDILKIIELLFPNYLIPNIENKFKAYYKSLENCNLNKQKLKNFYEVVFSNMEPKLIKKLGDEYFGYSLFKGVSTFINESESINEILHVFHHALVNDEGIYQSLPKVAQKENFEDSPITLYGKENIVSKKIYNNFPTNISCGWTDILSLDNKILMMVRDRGHALSIEIDIEDSQAIVHYYIPKICNMEMVNKLKGINKITKDNKYAIGSFVTSINEIDKEIANFISMVPMDEDMPHIWEVENIASHTK